MFQFECRTGSASTASILSAHLRLGRWPRTFDFCLTCWCVGMPGCCELINYRKWEGSHAAEVRSGEVLVAGRLWSCPPAVQRSQPTQPRLNQSKAEPSGGEFGSTATAATTFTLPAAAHPASLTRSIVAACTTIPRIDLSMAPHNSMSRVVQGLAPDDTAAAQIASARAGDHTPSLCC